MCFWEQMQKPNFNIVQGERIESTEEKHNLSCLLLCHTFLLKLAYALTTVLVMRIQGITR